MRVLVRDTRSLGDTGFPVKLELLNKNPSTGTIVNNPDLKGWGIRLDRL